MTARSEALRRPRPIRIPVVPALLTLGVFGWASFVVLAAFSYAHKPPSAAFDLELLLQGGRLVASGHSPYDPSLIAGRQVEIQSLFYSYPPIVAQLTSLVASIPSPVVFAAWIASSIAALAVVARVIRDRFAPAMPWLVPVLAAVALAPLWFPYTVGALFGNLDVFFPALYGLMLVAAAADGSRPSDRRLVIVGGVALALASITKLHPGLLALWFALRGLRSPRAARGLPLPWLVLAAATVTGLAILALSLAVGGIQPWLDYLGVLKASTNVDLLDYRNLGPVAQIVMVLGLGPGAIGIFGLGQPVAWLFLPLTIAAVRASRPAGTPATTTEMTQTAT